MALVKFTNSNNGLKPWFNDVFDSFLNDSYISDRLTSRVPAVNIAESDGQYHVELAVPGLKKEDFKISVEKNVLTIGAEQQAEKNDTGRRYSKKEYSYQSFSRSFTLPESADAANISASYVDGVLKVDIAKREEAKEVSRQINIQ